MAEEAPLLIMRAAERRAFIEGALEREEPDEISIYFRRYWPRRVGAWLDGVDAVLGQAVNIARECDPGRAFIVGSKTVLWLTPVIDDMQAKGVLAEEVNALITERLRMIYHHLGVEEEPGMSFVTYTKGRSEANRVFKGRKTRAKAYEANPSLISDIPLCPDQARQVLLDAIRGVRARENRRLRESNAKLSSRFDVLQAGRAVKAAAADRRSAGGRVGVASPEPHAATNHELGSESGPTISKNEEGDTATAGDLNEAPKVAQTGARPVKEASHVSPTATDEAEMARKAAREKEREKWRRGRATRQGLIAASEKQSDDETPDFY